MRNRAAASTSPTRCLGSRCCSVELLRKGMKPGKAAKFRTIEDGACACARERSHGHREVTSLHAMTNRLLRMGNCNVSSGWDVLRPGWLVVVRVLVVTFPTRIRLLASEGGPKSHRTTSRKQQLWHPARKTLTHMVRDQQLYPRGGRSQARRWRGPRTGLVAGRE